MKRLFSLPESERRASLAGVNLFFGVLLGANLGSINQVPVFDYVKLVILLSGSVMALYTIAVSSRQRVIWSLIVGYGTLLALTIADPDLRPEGMEDEMERIIATLAIWLLFLILVRATPLIHTGPAEESLESSPEDDPHRQ